MGIMSRSAVVPVAIGDETGVPAAGAVRPRAYLEILLVGLCYSAYTLVRNLAPATHAAAIELGRQILHVEAVLHVNVELTLNRQFTEHHWLGVGANYYYATLHFAVTIGVLVWLYARHPERYVTYRRIIFATTVTALAGFWAFPLAPPRMLPGFVDTVLSFHTWGLYESTSSPVASVSNQYAAMPSLHTAWSLWCAIAIADVARSRWAKAVAVCYPVATVMVIIGTANHYLLDAVGGALTLGAGYLLASGVMRPAAQLP
jgi:PAP2 superfamily